MLLYPIARAQDGSPVHIDAWERGQVVTCFGCDQDLVGRLPHDGIRPTAHFAHKADAACGGETALHRAAKAAIVRAHGRGVLQQLAWECPRCRRWEHRTDLRSLVLREESRPCDGVLSDVLGLDVVGDPRVAIEVIVSHDLEISTLDRYRACGVDVYSLHPSWGIVGDVMRGVERLIVDHRVGDVADCEGCRQVLREKAAWELRAQRQRADAWWTAWGVLWISVAREESAQSEAQQLSLGRQRQRVDAWWMSWGRLWPQVATRMSDAWWVAWRKVWREIGDRYAAPHRWARAWCAAWGSIGAQYAQEEMVRARRREEDARCARDRRRTWWEDWLRVWADIARRASGQLAAWRPICRHCRQDLTPGHQCL